MKLRIIAYVLASLCLVCTASCGEKAAADSSAASETVTTITEEVSSEEETTAEEETEDEAKQASDGFTLPELSDEIPAEAVTKSTRTDYSNGEKANVVVEYLDEHDNRLLRIEHADSPENAEAAKNDKYEYDSNGEMIYHYERSRYDLDEYYYEYDKDNNLTALKAFKDGKLSWEAEYKYDKYGNLILDESTYYNDETGEIMSVFTTDRSDCDYDSSGNMLTVRECLSSGTLYKTYSYTYDADGNVLTEKCVDEKFDPETEEDKVTEIVYEYDPVCGKRTFEKKSFISEDGEVLYTTTYEREFDSKGRPTKITIYYSKSDTTEVVTYEYEDIN